MTQLREFARHSEDLEKLNVRLIAISVDDQLHAYDVWEKAADKKFTILSDPGAHVIRRYGLLHQAGHADYNIAVRTTLLIGPDGRVKWRRVSQSVPDIPSWDETFVTLRKAHER